MRLYCQRVGVLTVALVLGACAGREDFVYVDAGEIPPGEGLFTDKSGTFEILTIDTGGPVLESGDVTATQQSASENATATDGSKIQPGLVPDKRYR